MVGGSAEVVGDEQRVKVQHLSAPQLLLPEVPPPLQRWAIDSDGKRNVTYNFRYHATVISEKLMDSVGENEEIY